MRFDLPLALWIGAGALGLAGVTVRVLPPLMPAPELDILPSAQFPGSTGPGETPTATTFEPVAQHNLFHRNRVPPESRFVPAGLQEPTLREAPPSRPAVPRLFGVAVSQGGAVALIDADPRIPGAEVYRVGDRVAGARLVEITDTAVVLRTPNGDQVLTLPLLSRRIP